MAVTSGSPARTRALDTAGLLDRFAARRIEHILSRLKDTRLTIRLPSGVQFAAGPADAGVEADLSINRWNAFWRIVSSGALGFSEGYVNGEWDTSDLQTLLTALASELDGMKTVKSAKGPSRLIGRIKHALNANTKAGSKRNISAHYDLGNAFYELWLDPSMTYSSALFDSFDQSLEDAQRAKYRRVCDELGLKPGDHVLEIGCGWGGFAEVAAKEYGARITGVTLSTEQLAFARDRMERAGLSDQVELRLQDYRDVPETYDAIASIEMFEAVGEEHWPVFFNTVRDRLKPGGKACLQIITIREQDFENYRQNVDFIQKYVFPGGMLPSPDVLADRVADAGLETRNIHMFGPAYAETLRRWLTTYLEAWPQISPMGFDDRFDRIWRYYLASCEAGFDTGRIDVGQFTYQRPG